jgi:uncharacterized protein YndB with AHSA1/START domain
MPDQRATLEDIKGRPAVRLERRLAHPPAKVWPAITQPSELAHWFPAKVEMELKAGAPITFTMEGPGMDYPKTGGEILEFDEPNIFAFTWNGDVVRFELFPDAAGSHLVFTHIFGRGEPEIAKLTAARTATGWGVCLDMLDARLGNRAFEQRAEWLGPIETYVEEFGLREGEVLARRDGTVIRFRRDLMWKSVEDVWELLTEGGEVTVGAQPPVRATNARFEPGEVTTADAPGVLEYEWLHEGTPGGRVRWEFTHDPLEGTRVELTQTLPAGLAELCARALAAWQVHLELFFALTHDVVRPWPAERVQQLEKRYTD